uniref:Uncharacterized protein n=1 Tax=Plectus sambesii TaxID=2011161 RepID=A0A914VTF9_9BILA
MDLLVYGAIFVVCSAVLFIIIFNLTECFCSRTSSTPTDRCWSPTIDSVNGGSSSTCMHGNAEASIGRRTLSSTSSRITILSESLMPKTLSNEDGLPSYDDAVSMPPCPLYRSVSVSILLRDECIV